MFLNLFRYFHTATNGDDAFCNLGIFSDYILMMNIIISEFQNF